MISAGIIRGIMVGPWEVLGSIKMTINAYLTFLSKHVDPWSKKQRITFRITAIFMQDNFPLHTTQ